MIIANTQKTQTEVCTAPEVSSCHREGPGGPGRGHVPQPAWKVCGRPQPQTGCFILPPQGPVWQVANSRIGVEAVSSKSASAVDRAPDVFVSIA